MKKQFFNSEDFDIEGIDAFNFQERAAEAANAKLQKLIDEAPTVYSRKYADSFNSISGWRVNEDYSFNTHKAKLMFVEKLQPCKHEPRVEIYCHTNNLGNIVSTRCIHCGVSLVANWEESNENT